MVSPINWNIEKLIVVDQAAMIATTPETDEIYIALVNGIIQTKDDADVVRTYATLDTTQAFTGKTMDGDLNTFQDIALTAIKTVGANTKRFITRDASGVISDATSPAFDNANHTHLDAANGGTLSTSALASGTLALARGGLGASLASSGPGTLVQTSNGANVSTRLDKLNGTAAPTVNDDSGDGYSIGSRWYDLTNDKEYVLLDSTVGAAVWVETTATGGSGGTVDIEDEGSPEGAADTIDFVGAGVSVGFSAGKATVTIPGGGGGALDYVRIADVRAFNVSGGAAAATTWHTRNLNTKVADTGTNASVSRMSFNSGGTYEVLVGDTLTGATSGATGVVFDIELTSGSWAGGDAAGTIWLNSVTGTFNGTENANVGANSNVLTTTSAVTNNRFRLTSGTYRIRANAPCYNVQSTLVRLRNISDSSDALVGNSMYTSGSVQIRPFIDDRFTIAANKTFELLHFTLTNAGAVSDALGIAHGQSGYNNIYAEVVLEKE